MRRFHPVAHAGANADSGSDSGLSAGRAVFELRTDFEQHLIGKPSRLVACRRCKQGRQHARTQRIHVGGDGVFDLARIVTAAKQFGMRARNEGVGNRFVETARGKCPADGAGAPLRGRERGMRHGARPRHGRGRHFVKPVDAHHFLNKVGRTGHIAAP